MTYRYVPTFGVRSTHLARNAFTFTAQWSTEIQSRIRTRGPCDRTFRTSVSLDYCFVQQPWQQITARCRYYDNASDLRRCLWCYRLVSFSLSLFARKIRNHFATTFIRPSFESLWIMSMACFTDFSITFWHNYVLLLIVAAILSAPTFKTHCWSTQMCLSFLYTFHYRDRRQIN